MRVRVTLLASRSRADVSLPTGVPVADLLPDLADLVGQADPETPPRAWVLARLGGRELDPEATLAAAGLVDGDLLELVAPQSVAPPVVSDRIDEIAEAAASSGGVWGPAARRRLLLVAGPVAVALGAAGVLPAGPAVLCLVLGLVVGAVTAAASFSLRVTDRPAALALTGAGLTWWSLAGAGAGALAAGSGSAGTFTAGAAPVVVGGAIGLLVGAAASVLLTRDSAPFAGVALVGIVGLAASGAVALGASVEASAAVAVAVAAVLPILLGSAAVRLAGVHSYVESGVDPETDRAQTPGAAQLVAAARDLSVALLAADGIVLVAGAAVLGAVGGGWALALALVAGAVVALRGASYRFAVEVVLCVASGLLALAVAAGAGTATAPGSVGLRLAGALALALGLVLTTAAVSRSPGGPTVPVWLGRLRVLGEVALVPLALGAVGLFSAIRSATGG